MSANCVACGSTAEQACTKCGTSYCSKECQTIDWEGGHAQTCTQIGAAPSVAPTPVPGKMGPDTEPFVVPHQAPKKGEGGEPMVVPLPRVSVEDLVSVGGVDMSWLAGKRPYYMLDFQHAPAPVRALYDDETSPRKLIEETRRFHRDNMHRVSAPHIPPLRMSDVVLPMMRGLPAGEKRVLFLQSVKQMNAIRQAFNDVGDALWELFEMNNATDAHFASAYSILLTGQDAITRVEHPAFAFTLAGTALHDMQMDNAQRLFELVDDVVRANGSEPAYVVQNTGALVGRMFMTSLFENEAYVTATLKELTRRGNENAAQLTADTDNVVAKRIATSAIAGAKAVVETYRGKMSGEEYAFCVSLLITIEAYGDDMVAREMPVTGFVSAPTRDAHGSRGARYAIYAIGALYAATTITDVCFGGGGQATAVLSTMLPTIAGAAAAATAMNNPGGLVTPTVAIDQTVGAVLDDIHNVHDDSAAPDIDISVEETQDVLSKIYAKAEEMNDRDPGVNLGLKNGVPVIAEVLREAKADYTAASERRDAAKLSLDNLQDSTAENAKNLAQNIETLLDRRSVEQRVAQLSAETSEDIGFKFDELRNEIQDNDYSAILGNVVVRLTPLTIHGDASASLSVIPVPDEGVVSDVVRGAVREVFGDAAHSTAMEQVIANVAESVKDNWDDVQTVVAAHYENSKAEETDATRELRSVQQSLRNAYARETKGMESTISQIKRAREHMDTYTASYEAYEAKANEAEEARRMVKVTEIAAESLAPQTDISPEQREEIAYKQTAVTSAVSKARVDKRAGMLRQGYMTYADETYDGAIARNLLSPMVSVEQAYLNVSLIMEAITWTASNVSAYYSTHAVAMLASLASAKTTLGAVYHLAKIGVSYTKLRSLKKATDSVNGVTGMDGDVMMSGLYARMTTVMNAKAGETATPLVSHAFNILCRSLYLGNAVSLSMTGLHALAPGVLPDTALEWASLSAKVLLPIFGITVAASFAWKTKIPQTVAYGIRSGDLALQRLAIRGYLSIMMGKGNASAAAKCAQLMRAELGRIGSGPETSEHLTASEWEILKRKVLTRIKVSDMKGIVELDAWYSGLSALLNILGALIVVPLATMVVKEKLRDMLFTGSDNTKLLNSVLVQTRGDAATTATNVDEMLFFRQALTTEGKEARASGVKLIRDALMKEATRPTVRVVPISSIIVDDRELMAKAVAVLEDISSHLPKAPIEITANLLDTFKRHVEAGAVSLG